MTRARTAALLLLLVGTLLFIGMGTSWQRTSPVAMIDFKAVYCGARALLEHRDPYNAPELERIYITQGAGHATDRPEIRLSVTRYIYPPSAFILTLPFALLPWSSAHTLWMVTTAATLVLAAFLMWTLAAPRAPIASALLLAVLLSTSELLLEVGNAAGIAVSLCVIAVWCFLTERHVPLGIACLAIALLAKPHDAALVWLYFVLASGPGRKRAVQTFLLVAILAVPLILWTSSVSPHWLTEISTNLSAHGLHGADSDPGPSGVIAWTHGAQLISLQTVFSLFWDNPRFYNSATYVVCGALLLLWTLAVVRAKPSTSGAFLALASISAVSMLPTYHRQQDTRLILLTIPAFALLWTARSTFKNALDPSYSEIAIPVNNQHATPPLELPANPLPPSTRWLAFAFTGAAVFLTGDIPLQLLGLLHRNLAIAPVTPSGKLLTVLFARPAPLALLALAVFYLWMYLRFTHAESRPVDEATDQLLPQAGAKELK